MLEMVCESVNESLTTAWRKLPNHADEALHFRPIGEPGEPTNVADRTMSVASTASREEKSTTTTAGPWGLQDMLVCSSG